MKKITAILLAYYPERFADVLEIVRVLKEGSRPPDKIIIFNNNPEISFEIDGVTSVQSSENMGAGIRFALGLGIKSDYYYFIDDDMCPETDTIKNFEKYAHSKCCFSFLGKHLIEGAKYSQTDAVWSDTVTEPIDIDIMVGAGSMFCSYEALINMYALENRYKDIKDFDFGRNTDITLSRANSCQLIPFSKGSGIHKFPFTNTGLCLEKNHGKKRDAITDLIF